MGFPTGKYIGRRDSRMLKASTRRLCLWGLAIALIFTAIYASGGTLILRLLSSDGEVVDSARDFLPWAATIPAAGFMAFTWDGIFIGATATRWMLASMGIATAVFFIVLSLAHPALGNHGLWLAFILYLLVRGAVLDVGARRHIATSP